MNVGGDESTETLHLANVENNPNKSNFPSLSPDTFSIDYPIKEETKVHAYFDRRLPTRDFIIQPFALRV